MPLSIWTERSGYSFGSFDERIFQSMELPVNETPSVEYQYQVISGALPPGLRLDGKTISGTPYEVIRTTEFSFCIRATANNEIADRTFNISIIGSDRPVFLTPPGTLAVGANNKLYILDQSEVNYQIEAYDLDTAAGQTLEYYITDGELPPGLTLTRSGLITGFIEPALAIALKDGSGKYDTSVYDGITYDFSGTSTITNIPGTILYANSKWLIVNTVTYNLRPGMVLSRNSGTGSFGVNTIINEILYSDTLSLSFDTQPTSGNIVYTAQNIGDTPTSINRNYEFKVAISDGENTVSQTFKIFVVGKDFFTSDNTIWTVDSELFSADVTELQPPTWITDEYLGTYRSDNYQTFILDVYGTVSDYRLELVNVTHRCTSNQFKITDNVAKSNSLTFISPTTPQVSEWVSFTKEYYIRSWTASSRYYIGDLVLHNNVIYKCKSDHVSSRDPDAVETELANNLKWNIRNDTWKPHTYYEKNLIILYDSITYICTSTHTSSNDPTDLSDTNLWSPYPSIECYRITHVETVDTDRYRVTLAVPLAVNVSDDIQFYSGTLSQLPPNMSLDTRTGEVYGYIPYQNATTIPYWFTISANNISPEGLRASSARQFRVDVISNVDSSITWISPGDLGFIEANYTSLLKVQAKSTRADVMYTLKSGNLPPGLTLAPSGEIIGRVTQYGFRGTNQTTYDLSLNDETTFDNDATTNDITIGGFSELLQEDGFSILQEDTSKLIIIAYKNEYILACDQSGLTTFDLPLGTLFDRNEITFDRQFEFTVQASDVTGYSTNTKTFTITVRTPYSKIFSNIYTPVLLPRDQRQVWHDFVHNTDIFTPSYIFRNTVDLEFGIPQDIRMLIYGGIETVSAAEYVSMMNLNVRKKRFQFGSIKLALAIAPGTQETVYEVIYVEVLDPQEPRGLHLPQQLTNIGINSQTITVDNSKILWRRGIDELSIPAPESPRPSMDLMPTADTSGHYASNPNTSSYFTNSITNWRNYIRNWGDVETERNYLPLWMRSIQPSTRRELGFILAIPLCYCNPGTGQQIMNNISYYMRTSGFSFDQFDFVADRFIIIPAQEYHCAGGTRYFVFDNQRFTI